jgi:internalin A
MTKRLLVVSWAWMAVSIFAGVAIAADGPSVKTDEVVLHFPADRPVGWLSIVGRGPIEDMAVAQGDVRLPRGSKFCLYLSRATADLSWLRDMPQYGLEAVDCRDDDALAQVLAIQGLKGLYLSSSNVDDDMMTSVAGLTSLENISINAKSVTSQGLGKLKPLKLKRLWLFNTKTDDDCLATIAKFDSLETLALFNLEGFGKQNVTDAGIAQLHDLTKLESLVLRGTKLTDVGMASLSGLRNLKKLTISGTAVTDEGLKYLAGMRGLTWLDVDAEGVSDAALAHIVHRTQLEHLTLRAISSLTAFEQVSTLAALRELEATVHKEVNAGWKCLEDLGQLESLTVAGAGVNDEAMIHIGQLTRLKALSIRFSTMTDDGLAHLAKLENLEHLHLHNSPITAEGLLSLAGTKKLKWLSLGGISETGTAGLEVLARWPNIEVLNLFNDSTRTLTEDQLAHLAALPRLRRLQLSNIEVTDRGAQLLSELSGLKQLWIDLGVSRLTDAGLEHLARLPRLENVGVGGDFTRSGLEALAKAKALQRVTLVSDNLLPDEVAEFDKIWQLNISPRQR